MAEVGNKNALPTITPEDLIIAGKTIWGEARGEGAEGQRAVGHVIINRWLAKDWYGASISAVCLKPWQFSCWNENDPNFKKINNLKLGMSQPLRFCIRAFMEALDEKPDPTVGATHYHTIGIDPPKWAFGKKPCARVGNHLFYNDVE